jgi:hypothetical protein
MHMLPMGMHVHPMLRIRFVRNAPISAPVAQGWIEARRTKADIGVGAWRKGCYGYKKRRACSAARRVAF